MARRRDRDTLLRTLPPSAVDDAERLLEDSEEKNPDPRDIVGELHRRGALDAGQLKEAVLTLESELPISHVNAKPPSAAEAHAVLGQLGAGAMGEVLLAKDPGLNRIVAVKRLHPDGAARKSMLRRFYTEAQITAQLDHPSIVPIHGLVNLGDDALAYAMKLVRGRTLEDYLEEAREMHRKGKVTADHGLPARLERFLHVCDALAYAHDRGIVHRDLKPENIMVGAFGEVMVMDWGIAKILARRGGVGTDTFDAPITNSRGTKVGTVMGTPGYMSPEQAEGAVDTLDQRSDQFALGLILQELVTLVPCRNPDMPVEATLAWAATGKRAPMKHAAGDKVPPELVAIVAKACAASPSGRYEQVSDLAEDIRRYLRDEAPSVRPDGIVQKIGRWVGRHRTLAVAAISLLAMAVVFVGLLGVAGALVSGQYFMYQAQLREEQVTATLQMAIGRSRLVDGKLADVEALASGLAFAAEQGLAGPVPELPYDPLTQAPPGTRPSTHYGHPITLDWPQLTVPPGTAPAVHADELRRLASVGQRLGDAITASGGGDARRRATKAPAIVAERGAPVVWAKLATSTGLTAVSPGGPPLRVGPDPRRDESYAEPPRGSAVTWSGPEVAEGGMGLAMTCSRPWYDNTGELSGVASVAVQVDHIVSRLVPGDDLTAMLLDREGRIIGQQGVSSQTDTKWAARPYPDPDLSSLIADNAHRGFHEEDGVITMWMHLNRIDATLVISGDVETMLEYTQRHGPSQTPDQDGSEATPTPDPDNPTRGEKAGRTGKGGKGRRDRR